MSSPKEQPLVHNFTNMSGSNRNQTRQTFLLYYFYSFMFGCLPVFDSWPVLNPAYLEYHSTHTWSIGATTNWVLVVFDGCPASFVLWGDIFLAMSYWIFVSLQQLVYPNILKDQVSIDIPYCWGPISISSLVVVNITIWPHQRVVHCPRFHEQRCWCLPPKVVFTLVRLCLTTMWLENSW